MLIYLRTMALHEVQRDGDILKGKFGLLANTVNICTVSEVCLLFLQSALLGALRHFLQALSAVRKDAEFGRT